MSGVPPRTMPLNRLGASRAMLMKSTNRSTKAFNSSSVSQLRGALAKKILGVRGFEPEMSLKLKTVCQNRNFPTVSRSAESVSKMQWPFTEQQYNRIMQEWPPDEVYDVLEQMSNVTLRTKRSAYNICVSWLKKRREEHEGRGQ